MQERAYGTDKVFKLWQIGPVRRFCRLSGDEKIQAGGKRDKLNGTNRAEFAGFADFC